MPDVLIIDAVRSPRGIGKAAKGALAGLHPQRVFAQLLSAVAERNRVNTADVDDVIAGVNTQQGRQSLNLARMAALDAGYDFRAPGFTLDRFCGSGMTAVGLGAMGIAAGYQHLVVAGGMEAMSYTQTLQRESMMDAGNLMLRKRIPQPHQGVCADIIATLEGITRDQTDAYALHSQRRADLAIREGRFSRSLIPIMDDEGGLLLDHEQFPRPQTTAEGLAALQPAFAAVIDRQVEDSGATMRDLVARAYPDLRIDHVHTAGTSSGVVDGGAALLLASPEYAKAHGLKPRARIRSTVTVGDDPTLMLNGPAPAAGRALAQAGMSLADIDLFEVNEAFAVVPLKFMRELDVDPERVNVNGGAIALGHPIGATGAILVGALLDELERRGQAVGLATMCAAGGLAPAMIIERI
jgi:acetyl-CoA C-acetyltransferase